MRFCSLDLCYLMTGLYAHVSLNICRTIYDLVGVQKKGSVEKKIEKSLNSESMFHINSASYDSNLLVGIVQSSNITNPLTLSALINILPRVDKQNLEKSHNLRLFRVHIYTQIYKKNI